MSWRGSSFPCVCGVWALAHLSRGTCLLAHRLSPIVAVASECFHLLCDRINVASVSSGPNLHLAFPALHTVLDNQILNYYMWILEWLKVGSLALCYCDKTLENINWEEERSIFAHGLRDFGPQSAGSIALPAEKRQQGLVGKSCLPHAYRKRMGQRQGAPLKGLSPVTCFLQLGILS